MLTEQYPLYGLVTAPGSLPAARLVGWFCVPVAVLAVFLLLFLVLLFPDGRLPSRWASFAARLQDATDLDAVQADLSATVDQVLQPAHLSLWLTS